MASDLGKLDPDAALPHLRQVAAAFGKRKLPSAKDVEKWGRRWKPHRTVASWYLWRAAEGATTGVPAPRS